MNSLGSQMYQKLKSFNCNLGNVSESAICAWFETSDAISTEFLTWFVQNIDENNVLDVVEIEEYQSLRDEHRILENDEFLTEVENVDRSNPGIFYADLLELEVRQLENDIATQQTTTALLNQQKSTEITKCKELNIKKASLVSDISLANAEWQNAYEECISAGIALTTSNRDLHDNFLNCIDYLGKIEKTVFPLSPTNIDDRHKLYKIYYEYVQSSLQDRQIYVSFMDSTQCQTVLDMNQQSDFYSAYLHAFLSEMKAVQLQAELNYLTDESKNITSLNIDFDDRFHLDDLIAGSQVRCKKRIDIVKGLLERVVELNLNRPKLIKMKAQLTTLRSQLDDIKRIKSHLQLFVAYDEILQMCFNVVNQDFSKCDQFFRGFHEVANGEMKNSATRLNLMKDIVNNYEAHNYLNVVESSAIVKLLTVVIENNFGKDNRGGFNDKIGVLESQLFFRNFSNFANDSMHIYKNISLLTKYLRCDGSNELQAVPLKHFTAIMSLNDAMVSMRTIVKSFIDEMHSAKKNIQSSKWLMLKRQLWKYFLTNPNKLIHCMEEIEKEVNARRIKHFRDLEIVH